MAEVNATGQVVEKTTRTRIISESAAIPDFWAYIEQQKLPDADHILYLYLVRDNRSIPYGQYTSHFPNRDGRLVPIDDREAFEQAIQMRFGGGVWRLILKCGKQKRTEARVFTGDGPTLPPPADIDQSHGHPNILHPPNSNFGQLPYSGDSSTAIASKAIDTIAQADHQAVNLALNTVSTAADVVKRFAEKNSGDAPAPESELQKALLQAAITRLTAPPPDPIQQFTQIFGVMRELSNGMNGGGLPPTEIGRQIDTFRSVMTFVREMAGSAGPAVSTGAEIVRTVAGVIPQAADAVRMTMEAWRDGKVADRDTVAMMQQTHPVQTVAGQPGMPAPGAPGMPMMAPPQFMPAPMPARPNPTPSNPPAPGPGPGAIGAMVPPSPEFIEARIVEMLLAPISAEEAAHRALDFLYTLSGDNPTFSYVNYLADKGETGLVNLFNDRPTLKAATADMRKLMDFIRAFLKFHREEEAEEEPGASKPN